MSESETADFDPTVLEDGTVGASQLDQQIISEAIKQGLITEMQGNMVLETIGLDPSLAATKEGDDTASGTLGLLVDRGLISPDKADELRDAFSEDFVPGFKLGRELGRGAMGVVYEATQKRLDRKVALKVVNPDLSSNAGYVKRFKREALTLAKLNHPNIVQVYDYGDIDGRIYLALEFVEGEDVSEMMSRDGALPEAVALKIARDAALGLSHAHQHGVIHRDIKPANLLLRHAADDASGKDFTAKVTDLGLAREAAPQGDGELTQAGTILGTPAYMAPEQTKGHPADYRCDIYALGASIYHMITGQVPYQDTSIVNMLVRKRTEQLPNPQLKSPDLSVGMVLLLDCMLARPPELRYQTYKELITDLDLLLSGEPPLTGPIPQSDSSLDLAGLRDTAIAANTEETTHHPPLGPGAAGLETVDLLGTAEPPPPEAKPGPPVGAIAVVVVVLILVAVGGWKSAGNVAVTPTPIASASTPRPVDPPEVVLRKKLDASLSALDALSPREQLAKMETFAALAEDMQRLPEADRQAESVKLSAMVGRALDKAGAPALEELDVTWRKGEYAALGSQSKRLKLAHNLADRNLPDEALRFEARAKAAHTKGAGKAERALWAEIEEGWKATERDANTLLSQFEVMRRDYAAFTPQLEEVEKRQALLETQNPLLILTPVPSTATISVDGGEPQAGKLESRFAPGPRALLVQAEGYRDLELKLDHRSRRAETLYLSPLPRVELVGDPDFLTSLRRSRRTWDKKTKAGMKGFLRIFKPIKNLLSQWDYDGGWSPVAAFAGMSGEGLEDDFRLASRRGMHGFLQVLRAKGAPGWSLGWNMKVWAGTRTVVEEGSKHEVPRTPEDALLAKGGGEARVLQHGDRVVVVGFDRGLLYAGVRGPQGLQMQRFERYTGKAPEAYLVSWDGDLAEIYVGKAKGKPRFFHAIRLKGKLTQSLDFCAARGTILFSDVNFWARVPK